MQISLVHGLPSSQVSVPGQQPETGVNTHRPVATLQVSVVQSVVSEQSPSTTQQSDPRGNSQALVVRLQRLTVQAMLSSHSESAKQHPARGVCVHAFEPSQASSVQGFPSSHSAAVKQQPWTGWLEHVPAPVLHVSVVHGLLSLQPWSPVQQPAMGALSHTKLLPHESVVH
jgi:hypothetical protein